jgi:hypothetical protein
VQMRNALGHQAIHPIRTRRACNDGAPTVPRPPEGLREDPTSGDAAAAGAPRPVSRLFCDGRSPGSRISAFPPAFPEPRAPVAY